jgi:hypothetical protein
MKILFDEIRGRISSLGFICTASICLLLSDETQKGDLSGTYVFTASALNAFLHSMLDRPGRFTLPPVVAIEERIELHGTDLDAATALDAVPVARNATGYFLRTVSPVVPLTTDESRLPGECP